MAESDKRIIIPAAAGSFAWCASIPYEPPPHGQRPELKDIHLWRTPIVGWLVDMGFAPLVGEPIFVEEIQLSGVTHALFPAGDGYFVGSDEMPYNPPDPVDKWLRSILRLAQVRWDKAYPPD